MSEEDWESQLKPIAKTAEADDWEKQLKPVVSKGKSFVRGLGQGATLGFGDELAGTWSGLTSAPADWLYEKLHPEDTKTSTFGERYTKGRDETRQINAAAEEANPGFYLGGTLLGGAAPAALATLATGGSAAAALPLALAEGGISGAGFSDESSALGLGRDIGAGIGLGALGHGVAKGLGKAFKGLASYAGKKTGQAAARAGAQATDEVSDALRKAAGSYGGEAQKGSRLLENAARLEARMTPEEQALLQQLRSTGAVGGLERQIAGSTLEQLPGQAAAITEKKAISEALRSGASEAIQARAKELSKSQFGKDTRSLLKSYAEPALASYLAYQGANALGLDPGEKTAATAAAGLIFGRTRAGKALMTRLTRPGNQQAIWNTVLRGAQLPIAGGARGQAIRQLLVRAGLVPATAAGVAGFGPGQDEISNALRGNINL
jgi:hypothetical protein